MTEWVLFGVRLLLLISILVILLAPLIGLIRG